MPRQLALDLPVRPALGRDDFFVSASNALALATLDGWPNWPSGKLILTGAAGAGKSHLAQVWARDTGAQIIAAADLAQADVPSLARGCVGVEDADGLGDLPPEAETALFHLHNLTLAEGGRLLITAAAPPAAWGLRLPDLASRMMATPLAALDAPDDALLSAMLFKLFGDRGLVVPPRVIEYLIPRMERSHAAAARLVADLDSAALERGGGITLPLASATLDKRDQDAE